MAKNFTLSGIGSLVNIGKGNANVKGTGSTQLQVRDNADAAFANIQFADGVSDDDGVTVRQLNAVSNGLNWKQYVEAASTGNLNLASMPATVDGVSLSNGDRFLAKDQTVGTENGIYIFNGAGVAATRAPDMALGADADAASMWVVQGTANIDTAWVETATPAIVGTNSLVFANFGITVGTVTSLASVDDGGGAGTFAAVLKSGTAPVPTIRSISNGAQISAVVSAGTNEIQLAIVAASVTATELATNSVTNPKIAADAVSEDKLAAGVAVLYRYIQITAAGFPATTGSNTVNLGSVLPANSIVQGGIVLVTTAFDNSPDMQVGTVADPPAVFGATDLNISVADTYVSSRASLQSSSQLVVTRTTNAAQPTVGVAEVMVNYIRPT